MGKKDHRELSYVGEVRSKWIGYCWGSKIKVDWILLSRKIKVDWVGTVGVVRAKRIGYRWGGKIKVDWVLLGR